MYACMYACIYACMYIHTHTHTHTHDTYRDCVDEGLVVEFTWLVDAIEHLDLQGNSSNRRQTGAWTGKRVPIFSFQVVTNSLLLSPSCPSNTERVGA